MGFLRSLSAGVTGLRNNTLMMDVIGNNVANVNTIGFKGSRITFSDMFSQTIRGASSPTSTSGGTNPMQIGLGATINSLDMNFSQGGIEGTGKATDLAIAGNGFFVVNQNGKQFYTRVGTFDRDSSGNLYLPGTGAILQGKLADATGVIPTGSTLQNMKIDLDRKSPAKATTLAKFAGNLDARSDVGDSTKASIDVFDTQGNPITLEMTYTKSADNNWTWSVDSAAPAAMISGQTGTVEFNLDGSLKTFAYDDGSSSLQFSTGLGTSDMNVVLNIGIPGEQSGVTQNKAVTLVQKKDQDGYASGEVTSWDIDTNGFVNAKFSNNQRMVLGQIMLAEFTNPAGLMKSGDSMYDISGNSGAPVILASGPTSKIQVGALEQSNVDLPEEFTRMIVAQRGFQSNARVITTSDEILNEVVNLKR